MTHNQANWMCSIIVCALGIWNVYRSCVNYRVAQGNLRIARENESNRARIESDKETSRG